MNAPARSVIDFRHIATVLRQHYLLWIVPTIACTILAMCYASVRPLKWKASQLLILRDESTDIAQRGAGDFASADALKTYQEMVVQSARNFSVVESALREIGPTDGQPNPDWPTRDDVAAAIGGIIVGPPKGAEFGKTTAVVVTTEAKSAERAEQFNAALVSRLERRLQEIRAEKAHGFVAEFTQSVAIAQADLDKSTGELATLESRVGRDLGELRTMNESAGGNSNLRESSTQLKQEIRTARAKRDESLQLIEILGVAIHDPVKLKEAPTRVFEAQPSLKRIQEGLADAQLKAANLAGRMTPNHPEVVAARYAESEVRNELRSELQKYVGGLQSDVQVTQNQLESLEKQLSDVEGRMQSLATLRAPYNNLSSEVKRCADKLADEQKKLASARSIEAGAFAGSVLIRRDQPDAGTGPVGPGAKMIVAGGLFGGLMLGFGLVFVTVPIGKMCGRRFSDYLTNGRRAADRNASGTSSAQPGAGRRAADPPPQPVPAAVGRRGTDPQPNAGRRVDDQPRTRRSDDRRETDDRAIEVASRVEETVATRAE